MALLLTRMDCGRFGGLVWISSLAVWCVAACVAAHAYHPGLELDIARQFYIAAGVALVYGPLAGLVRYQLKKGTEAERAGGGGCVQILFVMPMMFFYLLTSVVPGLLMILISSVFKKDIWKDGSSGWIAPTVAASWGLMMFSAARSDVIDLEWRIALVGAICSADFFVTWQIFTWDKQGRLAEPERAELPHHFFLSQLLGATLILGAYMTGLVLLFRD